MGYGADEESPGELLGEEGEEEGEGRGTRPTRTFSDEMNYLRFCI